MKVKAIVALLVVFVFTLGVVGLAFAAEVKGTVTKIDGKKITVKDAAGKETTVEVKDTAGVKVGDSVTIKDGTVTVEKKKKKAIEGC
jgi:predicted thioesterase